MSNVFKNVCGHVPVSKHRWVPARYGASLLNFHDTISYLAWWQSAVRFENVPNSLFRDFRGMDPKSVKAGRREAIELGWIGCLEGKKGRNETSTYWLLDLDGVPIPAPEESRGTGVYKYDAEKWAVHLGKISQPG